MKPVWREVDGILLLDKPRGLSSNQALQKARRIFGAAKGGHTGSLDPLATGLLPICFGEATKIAGLLKSIEDGWVAKGSTVVCTVTGNGLKDPDTALKGMPAVIPVPVDPVAVVAKLGLV